MLQGAEEYLAHQQGLQLLGYHTVHLTGTILTGEPFFQQMLVGIAAQGHGHFLCG